ncbi:unnamed protein product, partial [Iphiclides podalirius]
MCRGAGPEERECRGTRPEAGRCEFGALKGGAGSQAADAKHRHCELYMELKCTLVLRSTSTCNALHWPGGCGIPAIGRLQTNAIISLHSARTRRSRRSRPFSSLRARRLSNMHTTRAPLGPKARVIARPACRSGRLALSSAHSPDLHSDLTTVMAYVTPEPSDKLR